MPIPAERTFKDVQVGFDDRDIISGEFSDTGGFVQVNA